MIKAKLHLPSGCFLRYDPQRDDIELVDHEGVALPVPDQQRFFEQLPVVMLETFKAVMQIAA